ncbi:MAG: hypothetical protein K5755_04850 [Clostridiales bacterium]|nr:hypothetical protein [Clostridiales bacterium]
MDMMNTLLGELEKDFMNGKISEEEYLSRRDELFEKGYEVGLDPQPVLDEDEVPEYKDEVESDYMDETQTEEERITELNKYLLKIRSDGIASIVLAFILPIIAMIVAFRGMARSVKFFSDERAVEAAKKYRKICIIGFVLAIAVFILRMLWFYNPIF